MWNLYTLILPLSSNTFVEALSVQQGRKRPLDTPKKMIERREREKEREREKGRRRDIEREGDIRERERERERGRERKVKWDI